jgi:SynChlorMet cassette radical SAM/SPASM protein ScmF
MTTRQKIQIKIPALNTYYMYITNGCNLACRHCWISPSFEKDGSHGECLDFDLFQIAVDEGIPLGLKQIKFTGGEPLLHPDFVRMVDYATSKGIRTWMETNGTLLTKESAFHFKKKTSLTSVSVSVDGASVATHDGFRNVPGSFEQAIRGLRYLCEAGYKPQVVMSLFKANKAEIEPLIKMAVECGCGSMKFNIIQSSGRGEKLKKDNELLSIKELLDLGCWVEKELQKKYCIPLFYSWPMAFHSIKRLQVDGGGNCNLFNILGILSSGELALCGIGTQEKELVYGRLGKDSIGELWKSSPGLNKLREWIPDKLEGICGRGMFKPRCLGSSIAQNYHSGKRLNAPFWFCQAADEVGLFPANKYLTFKKNKDNLCFKKETKYYDKKEI